MLSAGCCDVLSTQFVPDPQTTQYRPALALDDAQAPSIEECFRDLRLADLPARQKAELMSSAVASPPVTKPVRTLWRVPNQAPDNSVEGLTQHDIATLSSTQGQCDACHRLPTAAEKDRALTESRRQAHDAAVANAKVISLRGSKPTPEIAEFIVASDAYRDFVPTNYEVLLEMQTAKKHAAAHHSLLTRGKKKVQRCPYYPVEKHPDDPSIANMKKAPLTDVQRWANRKTDCVTRRPSAD
jgi:hypothetical protein